MAADEDEEESSSSALSRSAHLFMAIHVPSEFDEDEDVEGSLGATLYAAVRGTSSAPYKNVEEEAKFPGPVPAQIIAPMLSTIREEDELLFNCMIHMRLITGDRPSFESKSWHKRRSESLRHCAIRYSAEDAKSNDPSLFLESTFSEGSIHGALTAALVLLHCSPSLVLKLGPVSCAALGIPHMMPTPFTTCEYLLSKILKRACDAASDFAARRALGEKPDTPPSRGIKSHPMTFLLFSALLGAFDRRLKSLGGDAISKDMNEALMYTARMLAINLWYLELGVQPAVVGLGSVSDAGEPPYTSLAKQCNAYGLINRLCNRLRSLMEKLAPFSRSDWNRSGLEECAFAWSVGLVLFYPTHEAREILLLELLEMPMESGDGNHFALEVLCGRLSSMPAQAKRLTLKPTIEALMDSIQRTWSAPSEIRSLSLGTRRPKPTVEREAPLSPASSVGGASVFSFVSARAKRGDEEEDEGDEQGDELASILGQTKTRSIGTNSVASSLIAVAGDEDSELVSSLIPALKPQAAAGTQTRAASTKSISLDMASILDAGTGPMIIRPAFVRHYQRMKLLWFLQGLCMVQQGPNGGAAPSTAENPANALVFDEPRCAETIQVMLDGRKAVQKADKKWGTAISSMPINLSLGEVFQWRLKVDKCEDSHIFFGVATRDVTSSGYLGEDAHGWGMIGKAHLWHNREKKGSFGEQIRSGDIVTLTLDCRKGTLSIANSSRDFGVAFKGLKEYCQGDSSLYPAVALYERGDTVTLLPASVPGDESSPLELGVTRGQFWSVSDIAGHLDKAMSSLDRSLVALTFPPPESYLTHVEIILDRINTVQSLDQCQPFVSTLSTLCLWPNNRITSKTALRLIPPVLKALGKVCAFYDESQMQFNLTGKWSFFDSSSSKHTVELSQQENGRSLATLRGSLLSKREGAVKVVGAARDSRVVLVEFWKAATRYVKLRLMPDPRVAIGRHQVESKPPSSSATSKVMVAVRSAATVPDTIMTGILAGKVIRVLSTLVGKLSYALLNAQDDDAVGEADAERRGETDASAERKWASSELFAGHSCDSHLSSLEALTKRVESDPALFRLLGKETVALLQELSLSGNDHAPDTVTEDEEVQKRREFLARFEQGECTDLDHWMLRFAGQAALVAKGGPSIAQVRRSAIAAFLLHSGIVDEARLIHNYFETKKTSLSASAPTLEDSHEETFGRSAGDESWTFPAEEEPSRDETIESEAAPHPSVMLIDVWRAGTRVVTWAIREKQQSGVSYEDVSVPLQEKAGVLLELAPNSNTRLEYDLPPPRPFNARPSATESVLRSLDDWKRAMRTKSLQSSLAERGHSEALEPVVAFLMDKNVNVQLLRRVFANRAYKALLRVAGFVSVKRAVEAIGKTRNSGAINCVVQWLPSSPMICAQILPLEAEPQMLMSDLVSIPPQAQQLPVLTALDLEDLGLVPSAATLVRPIVSERGNCLFGLDGCGRLASRLVQETFEGVLVQLSGLLLSDGNSDDTVGILEAWTLPLKDESDFTLILRIDLLAKLKTLLDECRSPGQVEDEEEDGTLLPEAARLLSKTRLNVLLLSCLRLIACLAHQIATDPLPNSRMEHPSKRKLVELIFKMAFEELTNVCTRLEHQRKEHTTESAFLSDEGYCFQLLQLLFSLSVTGPLTTRRFLCTSVWVQALLRAHTATESPRIQQRALRLLGRVLQYVDGPDDLPDAVLSSLMDHVASCYRPREEINIVDTSAIRHAYGIRITGVAECISLIRKILSLNTDSVWYLAALRALERSLDNTSRDENLGRLWATLAILGGFYEPLRLMGLVRFTSSSTQEFESFLATTSFGRSQSVSGTSPSSVATSLGVVVALQDSKCHVILPSLFAPASASGATSQNEDLDETTSSSDDRMRFAGGLSSSKQGGRASKLMSGVVCERSDLVPVSPHQVPLHVIKQLSPRIISLFDSYVFSAVEEEQKVDATVQEKSDESVSDSAEQLKMIASREDQALMKAALVKLLPSLMTIPEFFQNTSWRAKKLLDLGCRPTETVGLSDIHLVSSWWRALHECISFRAIREQARKKEGKASGAPSEGQQKQQLSEQGEQGRSGTPVPSGTPPAPASSSPDPFALVDDATLLVLQDLLALDLGFSRELCIIALERCGNDIEAAVHFCLEHANEAETLIEEFRQSRRAAASALAATTQGGGGNRLSQVEQRRRLVIIERLKDMGFSQTWCVKALEAPGNDGFNQALAWLLSNGDALAEQDEAAERRAKEQEELRERDALEGPLPVMGNLICSSGGIATTQISPELHVSVRGASAHGGFPSVVAESLLLFKGRWYYEVTIETDNCMQIGWGDACFTGDSSEGTGVGDDAHSWAYDGYRKLKWHQQSQSWGKQWKIGDVIGCAADLDRGELWFSLNGVWEDGMGLAFRGLVRGLNYIGGIAPAASFNKAERMRFNFGPRFKYTPGPPVWAESPPRPVGEAFNDEENNLKLIHKKCASVSDLVPRSLVESFKDIDDCFEESIGDALSDRYFSQGQFGSTSLLSRRSSSGLGGPLSSGGGGSSTQNATGMFAVKEPYPRACALSITAASFHAATDELFRVEPGVEGSEQICKAMEKASETLTTLYSRAACLLLLFSLREIPTESKLDESIDLIAKLAKTCAGRAKVSDIMSAVDLPVAGSGVKEDDGNILLNLDPRKDALDALSTVITQLIESSESSEVLFAFFVQELALACTRQYSMIPWDESDIALPLVVHSLWTMSMDDASVPMNEITILKHPSMKLTCWLSRLLCAKREVGTVEKVVAAWAHALRSPATRMKIVAARELTALLGGEDDYEQEERLVRIIGSVVEPVRIKDAARRLMQRSGTCSLHSVPSKYGSALIELASHFAIG